MIGDWLAIAWPPADEVAAAQAAGWRIRISHDGRWRPAWTQAGLEVWTSCAVPAPVVAGPEGWTVVGRLFAREGRQRGAMGRARRSTEVLLENFWGRYVALRLADDGGLAVLRDPSGAADVLGWRVGRLQFVASDLRDLPPGALPTGMAMDWDVIAGFVRRPYSVCGPLGLRGVTALAPGELCTFSGEEVRREQLWSPSAFARGELAEEDPGALLLETARTVVSQELAGRRDVLVEVSGGLDSSILAGLAAEAHGDAGLTALTFYWDRPEADERAWAREVCAAAGLPLIEIGRRLRALEEADFAGFASCARPSLDILDPEQDRLTEAAVDAARAEVLLTGQGGDAIFYQDPSAAPVADLLRAGAVGELTGFLAGRGRELRRSAWSLLAEALGRRGGDIDPGVDALLGPRALELSPAPGHAWLEDLRSAPPGKRVQIAALVGSLSNWQPSRRGRAAERVQPWLSQPMMELCLRIPSWRLAEGGRERGLARRAFASILPASVAGRRSKGAFTGFYVRLIADSLGFLRPWLLDGCLVAAEVLDAAPVETALDPENLLATGDGAYLLHAAMIEAWVRHWQGRANDARDAPRRQRTPVFY